MPSGARARLIVLTAAPQKNAYVRIVIIPLLPRGPGYKGHAGRPAVYRYSRGSVALSHSCPAALSVQHGIRGSGARKRTKRHRENFLVTW
jgi:hypothetical protein